MSCTVGIMHQLRSIGCCMCLHTVYSWVATYVLTTVTHSQVRLQDLIPTLVDVYHATKIGIKSYRYT